MNLLKAIIIDDELDCVRLLELQLNRHCPNVAISGATSNAQDGLVMLFKTPPDLLFLDIEMPHLNEFYLLEKSVTSIFKSFSRPPTAVTRCGRSSFRC